MSYQLVKPHHSHLSSFHKNRFSIDMHNLLKWHLIQFCVLFFTQGNSGWHSTTVNPERHPWQHHHKCCRKICLQQEEEDVSSQREVDVETIVPACKHSKKPDRFRFSFTAMKKWTHTVCKTLPCSTIYCYCCCNENGFLKKTVIDICDVWPLLSSVIKQIFINSHLETCATQIRCCNNSISPLHNIFYFYMFLTLKCFRLLN